MSLRKSPTPTAAMRAANLRQGLFSQADDPVLPALLPHGVKALRRDYLASC